MDIPGRPPPQITDESRTHGMGLIREALVQLRGEAGERQVPGARVAVPSSGGLTPSGALLLRTDR